MQKRFQGAGSEKVEELIHIIHDEQIFYMVNGSALESIVPVQRKGRKTKVQISANCPSVETASKLYEFLKISIADVNNWSEFKPGIRFSPRLVDKNGQTVSRIAKAGDLIKILLPRWQAVGRLYDWRQITRVEERMCGNIEIFFITIMPAINPDLDTPEVFHFLRPESTVTFFVVRDEQKLQMEVHTRNEGLNFKLSGFRTKFQSAIMGVFIAAGFYETQWTRLMRSILRYGMKIAK